MGALADRKLIPPRGSDSSPLALNEIHALQDELGASWSVVEHHHLEKEYRFPDFRGALAFTNALGELAEEVNHHPEICLTWGKAKVTVWTHSIGGLSEADFFFAARADRIFEAANSA